MKNRIPGHYRKGKGGKRIHVKGHMRKYKYKMKKR